MSLTAPPRTPADPVPAAPVSRRGVLKAAGAGAMTLLVAGTGAGSYRVYDSGVLHPGGGDAYDPWERWRDDPGPSGAIGAAILAASPHNTQPWIFRVGPDAIEVWADASRSIHSLDPYGREHHVGIGAAVENLVLACRARGFEPTVDAFPDGPASGLVARVRLAVAARRPSPLHDAIGRRHTDRGPFADRRVSADTRASLVDVGGLTGVGVTWIDAADDVAAFGRLMIDAATAVAGDDDQSRDGFLWFRPDDDAVQRHRDGLTLDAQGLSPLVLALGKLLPSTSRAAGDEFWVKQTRTVHTRTAAAYGVVTAGDPDDRVTQLDAGRLLQRIHLTATSTGVSLHHMNQITERIDQEKLTGVPATFGPRIAEFLPTGSRPLVAFRIGYPTRDPRKSPRRPVSAVMA